MCFCFMSIVFSCTRIHDVLFYNWYCTYCVRQGGYVFTSVCLTICLFKTTDKIHTKWCAFVLCPLFFLVHVYCFATDTVLTVCLFVNNITQLLTRSLQTSPFNWNSSFEGHVRRFDRCRLPERHPSSTAGPKFSLWLCRSGHTAVSAAVYLWIGKLCAGVDRTGPSKCWVVVVCLRWWRCSCLASHRGQFLVSFCAVHGRGVPYHRLVWAYRSLLCWRHWYTLVYRCRLGRQQASRALPSTGRPPGTFYQLLCEHLTDHWRGSSIIWKHTCLNISNHRLALLWLLVIVAPYINVFTN